MIGDIYPFLALSHPCENVILLHSHRQSHCETDHILTSQPHRVRRSKRSQSLGIAKLWTEDYPFLPFLRRFPSTSSSSSLIRKAISQFLLPSTVSGKVGEYCRYQIVNERLSLPPFPASLSDDFLFLLFHRQSHLKPDQLLPFPHPIPTLSSSGQITPMFQSESGFFKRCFRADDSARGFDELLKMCRVECQERQKRVD